MISKLTNDNFMLFAAQHYSNAGCSNMKEFMDDLKKFQYVKRLLTKYTLYGELQERLILNHIILLRNVFGEGTVPMLFFRVDASLWPQLKTFLVYLNFLPEQYIISDAVRETDIPLDQVIITKLRDI